MYSQSSTIQIIGVVLALLFIALLLWWMGKVSFQAPDIQTMMVRFILIVFSLLVSVWAVDKIIAFKLNLLSEQESNNLFELIKMMTAIVFGFYFGKISKEENK